MLSRILITVASQSSYIQFTCFSLSYITYQWHPAHAKLPKLTSSITFCKAWIMLHWMILQTLVFLTNKGLKDSPLPIQPLVRIMPVVCLMMSYQKELIGWLYQGKHTFASHDGDAGTTTSLPEAQPTPVKKVRLHTQIASVNSKKRIIKLLYSPNNNPLIHSGPSRLVQLMLAGEGMPRQQSRGKTMHGNALAMKSVICLQILFVYQ